MERAYTFTDSIVRYEEGEMCDDEVIELFQHLVDTGMAWQLQGSYGRTAAHLLKEGYIYPEGASESLHATTEPSEPTPVVVNKRGRKSTKQVGALVSMRQRRIPGQGIILERVEDVPFQGHEGFNETVADMSKQGYVGWGIKSSDHNHHNFVLVQWFSPPSEYTMEESYYSKEWYPDKWVKVISPAAKVYCEKEEK